MKVEYCTCTRTHPLVQKNHVRTRQPARRLLLEGASYNALQASTYRSMEDRFLNTRLYFVRCKDDFFGPKTSFSTTDLRFLCTFKGYTRFTKLSSFMNIKRFTELRSEQEDVIQSVLETEVNMKHAEKEVDVVYSLAKVFQPLCQTVLLHILK